MPGACVGLDTGNDGDGTVWGLGESSREGKGSCGLLARRRMLLMLMLLLLEAAEAVTDGERFASTRTGM